MFTVMQAKGPVYPVPGNTKVFVKDGTWYHECYFSSGAHVGIIGRCYYLKADKGAIPKFAENIKLDLFMMEEDATIILKIDGVPPRACTEVKYENGCLIFTAGGLAKAFASDLL